MQIRFVFSFVFPLLFSEWQRFHIFVMKLKNWAAFLLTRWCVYAWNKWDQKGIYLLPLLFHTKQNMLRNSSIRWGYTLCKQNKKWVTLTIWTFNQFVVNCFSSDFPPFHWLHTIFCPHQTIAQESTVIVTMPTQKSVRLCCVISILHISTFWKCEIETRICIIKYPFHKKHATTTTCQTTTQDTIIEIN